MEIKELHENMQTTWTEFKSVMEAHDKEIKQYGQVTSETKSTLEKINNRLDELDVELKRASTAVASFATSEEDKNKPSEAKAAFLNFCRKGVENMAPEEVKKLTISDDTTGGFLAPKEYVGDIIKGIVLYSPVRGLARIRTTSQRSVQMPKRTGTFAAKWVGENETRTETTGLTYGLEEVPNHELYALVDISFQDLEDSAFDLEAEIRAEATEQFGVAEGAAFVSGNAVKRPEGFMTQSDVGSVNSGDANLITADGLIKLFYELKSGYVANSTWVMNRSTVRQTRLLKDTTNQYIWQPGLQAGEPALLLGRPVVELPDMPNIAANAFPVAFGDFRRAYVIVDRLSVSVLRDPITQATSGAVRFIFRKRVGGQVILPEAIKKLKVAA